MVFFKTNSTLDIKLPDQLMFYLKTTETCQLNCDHCFTNGKNGKKGFFNVNNVKKFFNEIHDINPNQAGNIAFHGGEPMLAKVSDMMEIHDYINTILPNMWWSITTNLTYKLTDEIKMFFKHCFFKTGIGTSYDYGIRFENQRQEDLWKENIKWLVDEGFNVTLMVSVTNDLVDKDPYEFLDFVKSLNINYLHIERITPNGNALKNTSKFPSNVALDLWFEQLWNATIKGEYYKYFSNEFFSSILTSVVQTAHSGCRCRECEQKIFTLNADGTVGGCPNSAPENFFGHISDGFSALYTSTARSCNINEELTRALPCWSCEVFDICNGDCHQLKWQNIEGAVVDVPTNDDICAAPKSLMKSIKADYNYSLYTDILGNFLGNE